MSVSLELTRWFRYWGFRVVKKEIACVSQHLDVRLGVRLSVEGAYLTRKLPLSGNLRAEQLVTLAEIDIEGVVRAYSRQCSRPVPLKVAGCSKARWPLIPVSFGQLLLLPLRAQ